MSDQINREQVARDASNFIATFIGLGGQFKVTDDENRYILQRDLDNEGNWVQPVLTVNKVARPLAIYGTKAQDVCIINPFADGISASSEDNWFYHRINEVFSSYLIAIMKYIIVRIIAQKDKKNYEKQKGDDVVCDYVGEYASKVNKITLNEFNGLIKDPFEFFKVYVSIRKGTAEIHCRVFNDKDREYYSNIRKTTWSVLETMLTSLLKTDDDFSAFKWTIEAGDKLPKLRAMANIYGELYGRLAEPAKRLLGIEFEDLDVFDKHLKNLDVYYQVAHFGITASAPATVKNVKTAAAPVAPGSTLPQYSVGQDVPPQLNRGYNQPSTLNYGYEPRPMQPRQSTLPDYGI